jgi:hypothetical protein
MKTNIRKIMTILVAVAALSACSKKDDSGVTARAGVNALGVDSNVSTCGSTQQAVGRVYENNASGSSYTFEQRAKGLISATVDPQNFGSISGNPNDAQSGVTIEGRLRYDANGAVILDQSNLRLMVYDSYVGQKDSAGATIQPYPINFNAATSGTVNVSTKQFTVLFKDSYGEVTVTGTINNSTVVGSISYTNYSSYNGGQGVSAVLGGFTINACALIN